jgi:hypothetical protein
MNSLQSSINTIICLALLGCAHAVAPVAKLTIPQTEAECTARGGDWTTLGLPMPDKPKMCDLKATDSGKSCRDSSECQGICIPPATLNVGAHAIGTCSVYIANFGNVRRVTDGVVEELNVE